MKLSIAFLALLCSLILSSCTTNADGDRYTNDIIRAPEYVRIKYLTANLDQQPEIKSGKIPSHPDSQRWKRGYAKVRFTINEKGKTQDIHIVDSRGDHFGGNTVYAVRFWRFEPALKDGAPVACEAEYEIYFRGLYSSGVNE